MREATPDREYDFSASIREAKTPRELERVWIRNYRNLHLMVPWEKGDLDKNNVSTPRARRRRKREMNVIHDALKLQVERKGWELAESDPIGYRVPRLVVRGHQCIAAINGQSYKTGHWGNGAGCRYAMHYLREWVRKNGGYRKQSVADAVCDWVLFGMPHRALLRLRRSM